MVRFGFLLAPALLAVFIITGCAGGRVGEAAGRVILVNAKDRCAVYRRLKAAGFDPGPCRMRGDDVLRQAVMKFQAKSNRKLAEPDRLEEDGILGPATWALLKKVNDPGPYGQTPLPYNSAQAPPAQSGYEPLVGDSVFVVEKVGKCSKFSGLDITLYQGKVQEAVSGKARVELLARYKYRYRPNYKGIDRSNWYCIPARRHCYSQVSFGDWGGRMERGQNAWFENDKILSARYGLINALAPVSQKACAK